MDFKIYRDTREKAGYAFAGFGVEVVDIGLKTADYTVEGLEDRLCIERKASVAELAMCFGKEYVRFKKELIRMQDFEHRYLIMDFPFELLETYPVNSTIPKKMWKYLKQKPHHLIDRIEKIKNYYEVEVIFTRNRSEAEEVTFNILKEMYEKYK